MAKPRILIVEDEAVVARNIRNIVIGLGYEVAGTASSGEEAISKAGETRPDLALIDIVLKGDIDGVKAAEYISARFDIPIVYLTAYADEGLLRRAKITEPYGYILKPFEARELHTNIEIALYRHRAEKKFQEGLRAALERAKEEKAKTEAIIEAIGDGLSIQDRDYKLIYMNRIAREMFGDRVGEYCYSVYEQRDRVCEGCPMAAAFADGKIHRVERSNPTRTLHVEITTSPIRDSAGNIIAGIEVARDITKRKLAEQALRESEERYHNLFENAHDMIQSVAPDGRFIFVNASWLKAMGYTWDELQKITLVDILHPSCRGHCIEIFKKVMSGEPANNVEATFIAKDGRLIDVEGNVSVRFAGGDVVATQGIFRDITGRKKMEEQILQTKQDWENTFNTITDMITIHDKDFNIVRANKAAREILGLSFFDGLSEKCYAYYHGKECPPESCASCRCLETGKPVSTEMFEPHLKRFIEIRAIPRFDGNNRIAGLIHVVRDITERKKLEDQLRQSQKMEAIGELTGGIAHDFNNILTGIMGYGSFLERRMNDEDPLKSHLNQILNLSKKAANLTRSLLAFSRKQVINPQPVNINDIVVGMQNILGRLIGEDIDFRVNISIKNLTVMADGGQIEQVLMNLVTNARDAMPQGGTLIIGTGAIEVDETFTQAHGYGEKGRFALISVTDTGSGMDEETKQRIFEPFFTTKEVGKGTGLGLAMAYGIIRQHNGLITVYSEPGQGTMFKIYLPLVKTAGGEVQTPRTEPAAASGGTETVLIAEDEKTVGQIAKHTLEEYGYRVLDAADGEDAVNVFEANKDAIQLVILDVIMPKKNGKEAYEEIRKIAPGVKAIFMSGYPADIISKEGVLEKGLNFIPKPVSPHELLLKVREVLDKGRRDA